MARKDERSNAQDSTPSAECTSKAVRTLRTNFSTCHPSHSCSASAIAPICLTSTAALRESIHQRSRSNRDSGADNSRETVFTVGEGNADHAH